MPDARRPASPQELGFIHAHIEIGMAYAYIALTPGKNSRAVSRNRKHARTAYDTVLRFMEMAQIQDETRDIEADLAPLRLRLIRMGETFEAKNQIGIA